MRIGIDCRIIYDVKENKGAGVERYVFYLVKALLKNDQSNEYVLFFPDSISQQTIDSLKKQRNFEAVRVSDKLGFISRHLLFTFRLWGAFFDRMIFPANVMPLFYVGKSLLVIHDLAIYNHPEWFPNKQWFSKIILVPGSVAKATTIVTVSQATKNELLDLFKFKKNKNIHVVYPGLSLVKADSYQIGQEVKNKYKINNDYLFFVGTIEPRKNLVNVFSGYYKFIKSSKLKIPLVIAGARGWKYKKIFSYLKKINQQLGWQAIQYIGKITDRERYALLKHAQAFLFPTKYEGFGFPVLEAMAVGCPVLTAKVGALPEYITDQALFVDQMQPIEISLGIKKILSDSELREKLSLAGPELATQFTWEKTAQEILALI